MNKKHSLLIPLFFALSVFSDEWIDGICNEGQGYIEFTYGEYIGGCKDERTAHGTGTFIYEDTSTNFTWMEDGTVYEGDWVDGYMQGTGTLLWLDGRTYQGYFYKSQRYGLGFEARPDGTGKFVMYDENNLSSKDYLCIGCDLSNEGKLPMKITVHGGTSIPLDELGWTKFLGKLNVLTPIEPVDPRIHTS